MYDIFYILKDSNNDSNLDLLRRKFPLIKKSYSLEEANRKSLSRFFWVIWNDIEVLNSFDFIYEPDSGSQQYIHIFKNGDHYDGVCLIPKNAQISKREFEYRFFINRKEVDILASNPKPYDIIFISYDEPNADETYEKIKNRFSNVKRVHGVKGIHQAHIVAAELSSTPMFWVVDGDAIIKEDFNFSYRVDKCNLDTVHVLRSENPINGLVYGYGGVKLLPTFLTRKMDLSKPDMTTSISDNFKILDAISNVTSFNTDPFNTWKSAFRECVKLSSKIIDRQDTDETDQRLTIWCTIGSEKPFGKYSILGANQGKEYGIANKGNVEMLSKINDWEWLTSEFNKL